MTTKVDVTKILTDLDDKPIMESGVKYICARCGWREDEEEKPLTVRSAIILSLMHGRQGDEIDGNEQVDRLDLALVVKSTDVVEFTIKEAAKLQDLLPKRFFPLVTGQVIKILEGLDPKALPEEDEEEDEDESGPPNE
jgi:hypothetical protein